MNTYDIIIIGSGPGGQAAAIHAAKHKKSVALIEKAAMGGVCLNEGCIPSKALISIANKLNNAKKLDQFGVQTNTDKLNHNTISEKAQSVIKTLQKGLLYTLKKNNITIIEGEAKITSPTTVMINNSQTLTAQNILIATGSKPSTIPNVTIDEQNILSSTGFFKLKQYPSTVAIIGGGVIGIEFGYILNALGTNVYIIEYCDQLMPHLDKDTVQILNRHLKKQGIQTYTSSKVTTITQNGTVTFKSIKDDTKTLKVEKVLIATGRKPYTNSLGLDTLNIKQDQNGFIKTNQNFQTNINNIYAIGDVINTPMLAHMAEKEAECAIDHMISQKSPNIDYQAVPFVLYSDPEVAMFGLTEKELKQQNIDYKKESISYKSNGKAVASDCADGQVKLLIDPKTNHLIGGCIIGYNASEIIHPLIMAKTNQLTIMQIRATIFAHPTLTELLK